MSMLCLSGDWTPRDAPCALLPDEIVHLFREGVGFGWCKWWHRQFFIEPVKDCRLNLGLSLRVARPMRPRRNKLLGDARSDLRAASNGAELVTLQHATVGLTTPHLIRLLG